MNLIYRKSTRYLKAPSLESEAEKQTSGVNRLQLSGFRWTLCCRPKKLRLKPWSKDASAGSKNKGSPGIPVVERYI
jgi:hypothetical protein